MMPCQILKSHFVENPGLSRVHQLDYQRKLRQFARFLGKELTLDDFTTENISRWMTHIVTVQEHSTTTANNHRRCLMLIARAGRRKRLIRTLPRVRKLKESKRVPQGYDEGEMRRVIAACRNAPPLPLRAEPGKPKGTFTGADWEIYCRLVWESGARPTSLRTLRFVDVAGGYYRLNGDNTKTKMDKSDKLSHELLSLIEQRRIERKADPYDLIVDWPCCSRHLWTCLKKYITKPAGVSGALYDILKGAVSYIAKEKGLFEAARFRGHTDVKTTEQHYVVPRIAYTHVAACEILPRI